MVNHPLIYKTRRCTYTTSDGVCQALGKYVLVLESDTLHVLLYLRLMPCI
jgi:hypothetical protein